MFSNFLVGKLREKEKHEIGLWAYATELGFSTIGHIPEEIDIIGRIIAYSNNIPAIVVDDNLRPIRYQAVDPNILIDPVTLADKLESMAGGGREPIVAINPNGTMITVFYDESNLLKLLKYFPYGQLSIFAIFISFALIAFRSSKRGQENLVWVGMAKETAHQLGTPTSSLLGWIEYLRSQNVDPLAVEEMSKDLTRLLKVVDRFSKIGSNTNLAPRNIYELVASAVNYFQNRIPKNVTLNFQQCVAEPLQGMINDALFEWVIENLLKNALDALQGRGEIEVTLTASRGWIYIDVRDTGKGMPKANFKRIFEPGFTTKTRGWGLGLSLSKRIISQYHHGRIFVLNSEIDRGTTMRVMIRQL